MTDRVKMENKIYEEIHKKRGEKKKVSDDIRTNIIYFTTKCNLGCTYCYESLDEVQGVDTNIEELYAIADEAIEREPEEVQTFFEIFGGEPTLCWENVEKFLDYVYNKKENVYFEVITNGIKFTDLNFLKRYFNNKYVKMGKVSTSISFDGVKGNVDRIYRNGKQSAPDVIEALANLTYLNLPFRIRYTVHKNNVDRVLEDIEEIIENFNPLRIIISEVTNQLEYEDFVKLYNTYKEIQRRWNSGELNIPICDVVCETCDGCTISRNKLQYYIKDKKYEKNSREMMEFNHFENFKKEDKK